MLGLIGTTLAATAQPAAAGVDCPGHPGALGTSRTLVVDPREHGKIGTMQYAETLPLDDHEVVLTFDDGPIPKYSNQVLAILDAQCVKATFFAIGRMAKEYPEGVRKLIAAGHSVGTHSQNHPLSMNHMPLEHAKQEIDDGIASVKAALGDPAQLSPFFRVPGLLRADLVEDYAASQGLQVWSADFPADDWRHVSSQKVFELALSRLEAKGKGILLLHDIQARTVVALPRILQALKDRGYRIVHVVPSTPELPKTPTEARQWQLHPVSETVAISHWPKVPSFFYPPSEALPAPAVSEQEREGLLAPTGRRRLARGAVPLPEPAPWPRQQPLPASAGAVSLPVPAKDVFQIRERVHAEIRALVQIARNEQPAAAVAPLDPGRSKAISLNLRTARRPIAGSVPITDSALDRGPAKLR
jgi:peptidoglycan/xylan/chitin deacetylase (PgdA/CDA1 family)